MASRCRPAPVAGSRGAHHRHPTHRHSPFRTRHERDRGPPKAPPGLGMAGALGFGLTFPNPKRALRAHGVPLWGSSAPAHHTHPTAMQPVGGAHASSSSIYASAPSAVTCTAAGVGGREVHLCGAPSGLPLPWFCELKHLHMCSGGQEGRGHKDTVLAIQYTLLHW